MKTRGKNRFLHCFRPIGFEPEARNIKSAGDPVFTYIAVSKSDIDVAADEKEEKTEERRQTKTARRILSLFFKAKSPEILSGKARNGKFREDPTRSSSSPESRLSDAKSSKVEERKAKSSSSPLSSSNSSSSPKKLTVSDSGKSRSGKGWGNSENYGCATAMCFLVISLSVLVFWGRLCAIVWTSTCLCFARCPKNDDLQPETNASPVSVATPPAMEERDWRRRVVMQGLLERQNH